MGKGAVVVLGVAVLVGLAGYFLDDPLPGYMDDYWRTKLWTFNIKVNFLSVCVHTPCVCLQNVIHAIPSKRQNQLTMR